MRSKAVVMFLMSVFLAMAIMLGGCETMDSGGQEVPTGHSGGCH